MSFSAVNIPITTGSFLLDSSWAAPTLASTGFSTVFNASGTQTMQNIPDGIEILDNATSADNITGLYKAYPTPPFTATAMFTLPTYLYGSASEIGFAILQAPTTSLTQTWAMRWSGSTWQYAVVDFTNFTTYSGTTPYTNQAAYGNYIFLRFQDTGTVIYLSSSYDNWFWFPVTNITKAGSFMNGNFNYLALMIDRVTYSSATGTVGTVCMYYNQTSP
jgi:hypothetical protein